MGGTAIRAGKAFVELFADDSKLVRGLRRAQKRLVSFGKFTTGLGKKLLGGAAALAAPFVAATSVFAGFSDQMLKVKAVTKGTEDEFLKLNETAKLLGRTTSFTASQVAAGMAELGRAGFDRTQIDNAISSILSLSRATDTELPEAAEIAGGVLRGFGLDVDQMARVVDVLTATANGSSQTLTDLGEAIKVVAPIAADAGHSVEDVSTAIGLLANNSIKGSLAGSALARAYKNLATDKVQKMFEGMKIPLENADGSMRNLGAVMADLGKKTKSLSALKRLNIFEKIFGRGQAAALKLSKAGAKFEDLNDIIKNSGGAAKKAADVMDSGIGGSLRRLWSSVEGIAIAIGETLAPTIKRWAKGLSDAATWVTNLANKNKGFLVAAVKMIAIIAAVGTGLIVAGAAVVFFGSVLGTLISGFAIVASAIGSVVGVVVAMAGAILSPVGLLVAAIAGAAVAVWASWDDISSLFADMWSSIVSGAKSAWGGLVGFISGVIDGVVSIVKSVGSGIASAWSSITSAVKSATKSTIGYLKSAWSAVSGWFISTFAAVGNFFGSMWNSLIGGLGSLWGSFADFFGGSVSEITAGASKDFGKFQERALSAWGGIRDAIASGDIGLAFKIVTLALKSEWIRLTGFLSKKWNEFASFFSNVWTNAAFNSAKTMTNAWAGLEGTWLSLTGVLMDGWSMFTGFIQRTWNSTVGFLKKAWNGLKEMVTGKKSGVTSADIDKETAKKNEQVEADQNKAIMTRETERKEKIGKIEADRKDAIAGIDAEARRREDERSAADEADIAKNDDALAKAKLELAAARAEATAKRQAKEKEESDKAGEKTGKLKTTSAIEAIKKIQIKGLGGAAGKKASIEGTSTGFDRFSGLGQNSEKDDRSKMIDRLDKIEKHTKTSSKAPERTVPLT